MSAFLNWRFWAALILASSTLSVAGLLLARAFVSPPPQYYRATHFEFTLPDGWTCDRSGSETVCFPPGPRPADAVIILATKVRGERDHRDDYRQFLREAKTREMPDGHVVTSEVIYVRDVTIGGYEWIDALHRNSELNGHDTRYLVTTTSHIGLVVSFSAERERFPERNREFEASIASLKIYQSPSPFN